MRSQRLMKIGVLICVLLAGALASCSKSPETAKQSDAKPKTLAEYDTAGKTPLEVAQFVFDNYDCKSCHTLGSDEKFGYTARGEELRKNSDGCVSLLTSMSVIVHAKEEDRTPEQKVKAAHFKEYGCVMCHKVSPGELSLTDAGQKLASFHLSCSEVQQVLNQRASSESR